jgi:hypothetical protein
VGLEWGGGELRVYAHEAMGIWVHPHSFMRILLYPKKAQAKHQDGKNANKLTSARLRY